MLMLGWLALAPICGVLNWRPHCFVYGPPRCGKTTLHQLAAKLLDPLVISTDGQSSEAGIRQKLGPDSLPIIIDEFESDQKATNLKNVIKLARSASSAEDPVLRGTAGGQAMQFSLRTMFFFCAINPRGLSPADLSRILLFEMRMHNNSEEVARHIIQEQQYFQSLGPSWCSYMVSLASLIEPAIKAFEQTMPTEDRRHRQNFSALLAGAFVALYRKVPDSTEASEWAATFAPTVELHAVETERDDATDCLDYLLSYDIEGHSLGQLLATHRQHQARTVAGEHDFCAKLVHQLGIKLQLKGENPGVYIANGSPRIEKIFSDTIWAERGWERSLHKIEGAQHPKNSVYFSHTGRKHRCVCLPLEVIPPSDEISGV
jgi:hypothetical protein